MYRTTDYDRSHSIHILCVQIGICCGFPPHFAWYAFFLHFTRLCSKRKETHTLLRGFLVASSHRNPSRPKLQCVWRPSRFIFALKDVRVHTHEGVNSPRSFLNAQIALNRSENSHQWSFPSNGKEIRLLLLLIFFRFSFLVSCRSAFLLCHSAPLSSLVLMLARSPAPRLRLSAHDGEHIESPESPFYVVSQAQSDAVVDRNRRAESERGPVCVCVSKRFLFRLSICSAERSAHEWARRGERPRAKEAADKHENVRWVEQINGRWKRSVAKG